MSEERSSGTSGLIFSFLLGGLTGAALAILFAPRSGKETREMLGQKFREGAEKGRQLRDRMAAKGRETLGDATDYVERQREAMERRKDRLSSALDAGRQAYREEKDKM